MSLRIILPIFWWWEQAALLEIHQFERFFLVFSDVFFSTSFCNNLFRQRSCFFCSDVSSTLPFNTFLAHSDRQRRNSELQFCCRSVFRNFGEARWSVHKYDANFFNLADMLIDDEFQLKWLAINLTRSFISERTRNLIRRPEKCKLVTYVACWCATSDL